VVVLGVWGAVVSGVLLLLLLLGRREEGGIRG
jgi:hypothetical protein